MSWTFKYFKTHNTSSEVTGGYTDITDVIGDISIEETVGDEMLIKSGDIKLKLTAPLPFDNSLLYRNWLGIYWNTQLYNVYYIGSGNDFDNSYLIKDEKRPEYELTLYPIQKMFFDHLKTQKIFYSAIITDWNYDLAFAKVDIEKIKIRYQQDPPTYGSALNRWGFSIVDMIGQLGQKNNGYGYVFSNPNLGNFPIIGSDDLPIIYRGISLDQGLASLSQALAHTFSDWDVSWLDIFKLVIFGFNAYVSVKPSIGGSPEQLIVNLKIVPRINVTASSPGSPQWLERTFEKYRYRIDGVKLSGLNFEYTQGQSELGNIFSRSVDIADPEQYIPSVADDTLYWSVGDQVSGNTYSIVDGSDNPRPYFASGLVEPYYADIISDGHGHKGEIIFQEQDTLDQVNAGSDVIHLNKISINRLGVAKVEGIVI